MSFLSSQTVQDVIGGAAIIGVLIYGLNGKSKSNALIALSEETKSLRNQKGDLEIENARLKTRAEKAEENEQYLKDIAQSKPDFEKLSVQLTSQHQELMGAFTALTKAVTRSIK